MVNVVYTRRRGLAFLAAGSLVVGLGAVATGTANSATPCAVKVTALSLDSKQHFAGGSLLKRYSASVDYPVGTTYDQSAKVVLGVYPSTAYPILLKPKIGLRTKTGDLVKTQAPTAVAAINGDFFATPTINGQTFEIARGPMIQNGHVIRADRTRLRVVGVDKTQVPFGGYFGVRGQVRRIPQTGTAPAGINIAGINWQKVQGNGATVYTTDWNASTTTPRPAGVVEWVLNAHNKIKAIRTTGINPGNRGNPVAAGTRVVAFPLKFAQDASAAVTGDKVHVNIKQSTDTGVKLESAMGRGLPLITDGVKAPLGCDGYPSKAARPRTMIGWTKTGAWRTFIVPGKLFTGPGLREGGFGLAMEAAIAKQLGLYQAFELDGGGSTTMYTRSTSGKWKRRDLYGLDTTTGTYQREVINALGFMVP